MVIPNDPFIGTHYIGKEEEKAVNEVLKSKSLFRYHGPKLLYKVSEFEKNMADFLGVKYVLGCTNGAAAIKLACIANDIGPGAEVLMSPFTFIASASSVLSCGAMVKFVDIDESMNINPDMIEKSINTNTKAILCIHMQGQICDMKKINKIAKKHNLIVIEDAAQAFGAKYNKKYSGTFGNVGCFSLQAGKTITCGEGGFIATNDKKIYEKAKMYHDNGGYREGTDYPTWQNGRTFYGENFKMNEIQGAIANEQLKKISIISQNQEKIYNSIINSIDLKFYNIRKASKYNENIKTNIAFEFKTENECSNFIKFMNSKGIDFNLYCTDLIDKFDTFVKQNSWHHSSFPYNINKYQKSDLTLSYKLFKKVAWFSLSASLKKKHIKYIIEELNEYSSQK